MVYQIQEYGAFVCEDTVRGHLPHGYTALDKSTFDALEEFILANNCGTGAVELMGISARRGVGKYITAKNYVGVISMKDGTTIEILPKIYSSVPGDSKKLLIDMLKTLKNSPYKSLQTTRVDTDRLNIFEIFIRMFIDEIFAIVKHGLKCNYESVQENLNVLKGKLIFSEHIKHNLVHKERFFAEHDEYNANRPENRLIKSTLQYLYTKSKSAKNRNNIKILLDAFADISVSGNYDKDFSLCSNGRDMAKYSDALMWCRVFLKGESFTSFAGSSVAYALLFPMELLFESYIAALIRKSLVGYRVSLQDRRHYLFDSPGKRFLMKPDIAVRSGREAVVLDTKWKILSDGEKNYGISQPDMYQMYAYQKKYSANGIVLIYPMTDKVKSDKPIEYTAKDGAVVKVRFVDLFDVKNSINKLCNEIRDMF